MGACGDEIGESQIRHLPSRFRAPHMHADAATCVWEAETRDYGAGEREREREVALLRGRTSEERKKSPVFRHKRHDQKKDPSASARLWLSAPTQNSFVAG